MMRCGHIPLVMMILVTLSVSSYNLNTMILKAFRFLIAIVICTIALALPYRARVYYFQFIAFIVHLPYKTFGKLSRYLLTKLNYLNRDQRHEQQ